MSESQKAAGFNVTGGASYRLGFVLVTVSAVAWSTAGFFTRLIPLDTGTMLFWRGLFGGLGILFAIVLRYRGTSLRSFWAMGWPAWSFALVSTFGMLCYIAAFRLTTERRRTTRGRWLTFGFVQQGCLRTGQKRPILVEALVGHTTCVTLDQMRFKGLCLGGIQLTGAEAFEVG